MRSEAHLIVYITIVLVIGFLLLSSVVTGDSTGTLSAQETGSGSDPGGPSLISASQASGGESPGETPVQAFNRTIPSGFIRNDGQAGGSVMFQIIADGGSVFFTGRNVIFARSTTDDSSGPLTPLSITFVGAGKSVVPEGSGPVSGRVNFITGPGRDQWHTGIPSYQEIAYKGLYPGIDLTYKSMGNALKSEFVVSPGADPSRIRAPVRRRGFPDRRRRRQSCDNEWRWNSFRTGTRCIPGDRKASGYRLKSIIKFCRAIPSGSRRGPTRPHFRS